MKCWTPSKMNNADLALQLRVLINVVIKKQFRELDNCVLVDYLFLRVY